ncbi:MFS general substrate transporter [Pholiota conissans]|uniref:MFS general substrate transporter n=1 Tax=Pholiota conissans TaxID=109636 RepID=A0A9P5ZAW2_9AGAR|nr:MFS general substrate transporter [Pholiota conissans]
MESDLEIVKGFSPNASLGIDESNEKKDTAVVGVQEPPPPGDDFPEGGMQAWLTVFGAFLFQFATFGYINAFGVYQDFYIREYLTAYSPSSIGWIGGMQLFLNFSSGTLAGPLSDRGYIRSLTLIFLVFILPLSHENSFDQVFLSNGVALGLSSGLTYVPSLTISTHYFKRKRAIAIGITSSGSVLGAVVHPIILNQLFKGHIGFHNGVRISAGINTFLLICATLMIRPRLEPKATQRFPVVEWLKEMSFLTFVIAGWFVFLGLFYPVFYLQLYAIKHGINSNFAFYSVSKMSLPGFEDCANHFPVAVNYERCKHIRSCHIVPRFGATRDVNHIV